MGIYPDRHTHSHTRIMQADGRNAERWIEVEQTPGLTRTRVVMAEPWNEMRTDCFCCSCGDREGDDAACRNHGYYGKRPCETHNMPGYTWEGTDEMPESVQTELARLRASRLEIERDGG